MSRTVTTPDWLNESFLQIVLQKDKDVKVNSVEIERAVPPGANYVCDLFRVHCRYQEEDDPDQVKEITLIVKTPNTNNEMMTQCLEDWGIIEKEYVVYKTFLPEVYKVLPKSERFTANLLYSHDSKTLILEDLKDKGFVMADRLKQLDFEHCSVCMKILAQLHAASVAVIKKKPELIATVGKEPVYDKQNTAMKEKYKEMWKNVPSMFINAVKTWEGFDDFEEKSGHVWETILDEIYDVFEPRKDLLNVINHGDLWLNNMMFKYDRDGNIVDFRLVDFQVCRYASPVPDLLYFLFSSANQEVREKRMDEVLAVYLETLNSTLESLDCEERLTKEQLDAEVKRCQCYVFVIVYSILGVALSDPDDLINLDEMTEENLKSEDKNPFEKCFYGKYYKGVAQQILRYLYNVGYFEKQ